MTRIIDLGNGYGRVERYTSKYASLTFPLNHSSLSRLYTEGYINRDELQQALLDAGYTEAAAAWRVALASVTVAEWKARLPDARTI